MIDIETRSWIRESKNCERKEMCKEEVAMSRQAVVQIGVKRSFGATRVTALLNSSPAKPTVLNHFHCLSWTLIMLSGRRGKSRRVNIAYNVGVLSTS